MHKIMSKGLSVQIEITGTNLNHIIISKESIIQIENTWTKLCLYMNQECEIKNPFILPSFKHCNQGWGGCLFANIFFLNKNKNS